jgi:hypothetical protein
MDWQALAFAIGNLISFSLYAGFIVYVTWLLFRNKKKLDIYMKMTLLLLGVSHTLLALNSIDSMVDENESFT